MDFKKLIDLADVKEKQAFAFTSIYNGKVSNEELQKGIDDYCSQMAESFIAEHGEKLLNDELRIKLRRYICSIGADKKHSGHRFYEALYKKIQAFEVKNQQENESENERGL